MATEISLRLTWKGIEMGISQKDRKTLWGRSGNVCSFPLCDQELAPEGSAGKLIGMEAHIKGEKPEAARYDPAQPDEDRDSYTNRILLCPTHHTMVDADPETYSVQKLLKMKETHETAVARNRMFPQLMADIKGVFEKYDGPEGSATSVEAIPKTQVTEVVVHVDASQEHGVRTGLSVIAGQTMSFFATGLISYDYDGHHFATPEGVLCNEYGFPRLFPGPKGIGAPAIFPHEGAYRTDGGATGRVGSLIGWIGAYSEQNAFFVGSKREIESPATGPLFLAVNDARTTYGDNKGEFFVEIRLATTKKTDPQG